MSEQDQSLKFLQEASESDLHKAQAILRDPASSREAIEQALFEELEKNSNVGDCFWLSHAWAESLIHGKTISKDNFPSGGVMVGHDPLWKVGHPDYRGTYVTWGAEPYMITQWTKGKNKDLTEREYTNLVEFDDAESLQQYLEGFKNGQLAMILIPSRAGRNDGHAALATKLNNQLFVVDSSMEPGAWIKQITEFVTQWSDRGMYLYVYPETVGSETDIVQ